MGDLERWRDEFPILARLVYLISNSLGAMPRQTARNLAEYADASATRGVRVGRTLVGDASGKSATRSRRRSALRRAR